MKKAIFVILFLPFLLLGYTGCNSGSSDWELVEGVVLPAETNELLNTIFSDQNTLKKHLPDNAQGKLYIINTEEELKGLTPSCQETFDVDFEKYTLLLAVVSTQSLSDEVNALLYYCFDENSYKYQIAVKKAEEAYLGLGFWGFWIVAPCKITDNVSLEIVEVP